MKIYRIWPSDHVRPRTPHPVRPSSTTLPCTALAPPRTLYGPARRSDVKQKYRGDVKQKYRGDVKNSAMIREGLVAKGTAPKIISRLRLATN